MPNNYSWYDIVSGRARISQELEDNPDLRRKLMASASAEVGDQNDQAKQAYIESVMNRAVARNQSLNQIISSRSYYPPTTTSKLNRTPSPETQANLDPMINNALNGSNIAGFATGNQSGKVRSGGAPVSFDPGGGKNRDTFVVENRDLNWATGMGSPHATQSVIQQKSGIADNPAGSSQEDLLSGAVREQQIIDALNRQLTQIS